MHISKRNIGGSVNVSVSLTFGHSSDFRTLICEREILNISFTELKLSWLGPRTIRSTVLPSNADAGGTRDEEASSLEMSAKTTENRGN